MKTISHQTGASLIEVAVALFVLSIGLLGMAGLQMASLKANESSYERSAAVLGAYTMIDRLRADATAARAGSYNLALATGSCTAPAGTSFPSVQLTAWLADLQSSMGASACGGVSCTAGATSTCVISVRWDDSRASGGSASQVFRIEARL
ncbi:MAG TPA: type IV pilus modification protein PilV [Methyloversatilis sp.]